MAKRKRKEEVRPEGYDVLIGYVKSFEFIDARSADKMNGHPTPGRVYRIIKDPQGFRLHIGRENNEAGLDGIYLGEKISGEREDYRFDIELINRDNYLDFTLCGEDATAIVEWLTTDSVDLWEGLAKEADGTTPVIRSVAEFIEELRKQRQEDARKPASSKEVAVTGDDDSAVNDAVRFNNAINTVYEKDTEMVSFLVDFVEYVAGTYKDKYESSKLPNLSKQLLTGTELGHGAFVFTAMKYLQRYATVGFDKSDNVNDVYKIMHYSLFELQRRRNLGLSTTGSK